MDDDEDNNNAEFELHCINDFPVGLRVIKLTPLLNVDDIRTKLP